MMGKNTRRRQLMKHLAIFVLFLEPLLAIRCFDIIYERNYDGQCLNEYNFPYKGYPESGIVINGDYFPMKRQERKRYDRYRLRHQPRSIKKESINACRHITATKTIDRTITIQPIATTSPPYHATIIPSSAKPYNTPMPAIISEEASKTNTLITVNPRVTTVGTTIIRYASTTIGSMKVETTTRVQIATSAVTLTARQTAYTTLIMTTPLIVPSGTALYPTGTLASSPTSNFLTQSPTQTPSPRPTISVGTTFPSSGVVSQKPTTTTPPNTPTFGSSSCNSLLDGKSSTTQSLSSESASASDSKSSDDDAWPPTIDFKFTNNLDTCYNARHEITLCNQAYLDKSIDDIVVPNRVLQALSDFVDGAIFTDIDGTKYIVVLCADEFGTINLIIDEKTYSFPYNIYLTELPNKSGICRLKFICLNQDSLTPQAWRLGNFFIETYPEVAESMINEGTTKRIRQVLA